MNDERPELLKDEDCELDSDSSGSHAFGVQVSDSASRLLTSLKNPLVKRLRKLQRPQDRKREGLFLLEGTHLLEEVCAIGYPLEILCCTLEWQQRHDRLWHLANALAQRSELVSPEVLQAIATTVQPDGVLAVARRNDRAPDALPVSTLGIVLESIQDPGNLGTIIRTAAAAGAEGLWVNAHGVDLDHPKVLRATAGQWFRLPMATSDDLPGTIAHCQQLGMQVVATQPLAEQTYWQVDFQLPTIVLLGNEGMGLSPDIAELADVAVRIPLSPGVESLNVAITCALILYEIRRQRGFNPVLPQTM